MPKLAFNKDSPEFQNFLGEHASKPPRVSRLRRSQNLSRLSWVSVAMVGGGEWKGRKSCVPLKTCPGYDGCWTFKLQKILGK